ncbi:MAG: hypothetical protein JW712_07910, partial [Dehalococcoidales bacterium]|nr:hypothetical protein [Dehalococcoidales bacterium]
LYVWLLQEYPQLIKKISFTTGSVTRNETLKFMEKTGRLCLFKPFGKKELITFIEEALKNMENN